MDGKDRVSLIKVFVSDRGPVYEELPAIKKGDDIYELLSSPGLALNLARGDLISIKNLNSPALVLKRGGNFCINIYAEGLESGKLKKLEKDVNDLLSGTLDGLRGGNLAFSVPSKSGISNIQALFNKFKEETGVDWYYSNIYKNFENLDDDTLLNWWVDD
ncbi:DUF4265 domain-containing protein [Pantoea sp. Cy-639]|uniref:DUF4265 domain-containing protein n=1 Tax=Pantoea sp. Cy-639 TaxID=2608360 RepID=UPI0014248425|nr:DUF4265 domain-containing protein [Pantoea sp. Cy-639]NIF19974.1 DUF4265 domain-containing protein [Pantoea sp. Cy-639]